MCVLSNSNLHASVIVLIDNNNDINSNSNQLFVINNLTQPITAQRNTDKTVITDKIWLFSCWSRTN